MKTLLLLLSSAYGWADETGDLRAVQQKWAPRFHMQDWKVSLRVVDNDELALHCPEPCVAVSRFRLAEKTGEILVLCRKCYTPEQKTAARKRGLSVRADQRDSVVHELLHCVWTYAIEESAVAAITKALKP